jgi:hypothetical protein
MLLKCTLSTMVIKNAWDLCWMGMWILGWYYKGIYQGNMQCPDWQVAIENKLK